MAWNRPTNARWHRAVLGGCLLITVATLASRQPPQCAAQLPPRVHYLHHQFLPPGQIGQEQLWRSPDMAGYYQAVELIPPEGAQISLVQQNEFRPLPPGPVLAGMQLGHVYSVKLTRMPNREGIEVFPTVEIINRLHPPEGTKTRFPVPIEFSEEDIARALSGLFVMRVVYLEDSDQALAATADPRQQRTLDVSPSEDPLHVADRMGRPMAIVRIGSRLPDEFAVAQAQSGLPPIQLYPSPRTAQEPTDVQKAIERQGADVPREEIEPPQRRATFSPAVRIQR